MSLHIAAKNGDIADTVLMPGDPMRAKWIAEKYLDKPVCYNERRAAFGFTGTYAGKRVSVQATGMGVPSISIYTHEMLAEYGVKTLVRVGTCGSIQENLGLNDIVLGMSACTDSSMNRRTFDGQDYAPTANFDLLLNTHQVAKKNGVSVRVGPILTADTFYDKPEFWKVWAQHGVLAVEMESTALYTLAARFGARALTILTVSDVIPTHAVMPPDDRERSLDRMIRLALDSVTSMEA
jgi:purine-nucleoside phosphorylase